MSELNNTCLAYDPRCNSEGEKIGMGITQEDVRAHLIETNDEFRRLALQHSDYGKKLEALSALPFLTPEEQLEEVRLKKVKLRLKDQMEGILSRHRAQQVA